MPSVAGNDRIDVPSSAMAIRPRGALGLSAAMRVSASNGTKCTAMRCMSRVSPPKTIAATARKRGTDERRAKNDSSVRGAPTQRKSENR